MLKRVLPSALAVTFLTMNAWATFSPPPSVPIDRLIRNTEAFIKEHPDDATGPYTLGRIHYLALALRTTNLRARENNQLPNIPDMFNRPTTASITSLTDPEMEHFGSAVANFGKAIKMKGTEALFHLGMASVIEAAITLKVKLSAVPPFESGPPQVQTSGDLTALWREAAIAEYRKAYELAIDKDQAVPYLPLAGLAELVSYEAGVRYVAMIASRGVKVEERPFLAIVQTELIRLESKPRGAITPIIFSIDRSAPLDELLGNRTVEFDLDGTARPQRYSWVLPDTGILVWDPEHKGQITSGRQLFGSVTFNMLWSDGYRALDVLDDNRNGMVDGDELPGLAVWFDRNGDGMSDPGEVEPVENIAIQAISTWATHHVGDSLANYQGLQLTDEETLPTYDWTTRNLVGIDD